MQDKNDMKMQEEDEESKEKYIIDDLTNLQEQLEIEFNSLPIIYRNELEIFFLKIVLLKYYIGYENEKSMQSKKPIYLQITNQLNKLKSNFCSSESAISFIDRLVDQITKISSIYNDKQKEKSENQQLIRSFFEEEILISPYSKSMIDIFQNQYPQLLQLEVKYKFTRFKQGFPDRNLLQKQTTLNVFQPNANQLLTITSKKELELWKDVEQETNQAIYSHIIETAPIDVLTQTSKTLNKTQNLQYFMRRQILSYSKNSEIIPSTTVASSVLPSIIQIQIDDDLNTINCIEISQIGNVVLCGTSSSEILFFVSNSEFKLNLNQDGVSGNGMHINNSQQFDYDDVGNIQGLKEEGSSNDSTQNQPTHVFRGHQGSVTCLSLHYDELYFISGSSDCAIRLWCLRMKTCLCIFQGHYKSILSVNFSPNGYFFASSSEDRLVQLWSTDRMFSWRVYQGHQEGVNKVVFTQNNQCLVTSSFDKTIRVWDRDSTDCLFSIKSYEKISAFALSYSGYYLAFGQYDGDVEIWDLLTKTQITSLRFDKNNKFSPIFSIDFAHDQSGIVINSDQTVCFYFIDQIKEQKEVNVRDEIVISYKQFKDQEKNQTRFYPYIPESAFQIKDNFLDRFVVSKMHISNFIIIVSQ